MKKKKKIFISYCHLDRVWLERLSEYLDVLTTFVDIEAWSDLQIKAGESWLKEINSAMFSCDAAVLLLSEGFFQSEFIRDKELPVLLERREKDGLIVIPAGPPSFAWHVNYRKGLNKI